MWVFSFKKYTRILKCVFSYYNVIHLGVYMVLSFEVFGKVQGVMFRQTFIRGLIKRNLNGGATNISNKYKTVKISIEAEREEYILSLINDLLELKVINSWNATIESIHKIDTIPISKHEVTTDNVDDYKWSSGVEFYF